MIWYSITEYVNRLTGEVLTKEQYKNGHYKIVNSTETITTKQLNYQCYAEKKITREVEPQAYQAKLEL